jgi:hypothetical protein
LLCNGKGKVHETTTFSASEYVVVVVSVFIFVVDVVVVVVVIKGAVVLVQAMKAYGSWWRIAPVILNLDTRQAGVASQWATSFHKTNTTNW